MKFIGAVAQQVEVAMSGLFSRGTALAVLLALEVAAGAVPVVAAQELEIISLRHRPAEQLLPQLAPFVERGGALSGTGDTLFVRASATNLAQLRQLVAALDTPPRRLLITVRQGGDDNRADAGGGVAVRAGSGGVAARAQVYSSERLGRRDVVQQVQTLDGARAALMAGQSLALPFRQRLLSPAGAVVAESVVVRELPSGFVVVPRLVGDSVTLDISPVDATAGPVPGSVNVWQLNTTVAGRLGEWLVFGDSEGAQSGRESRLGGYETRSHAQQHHVQIKVDLLP